MTFSDWKDYYKENQGHFDWLKDHRIDTITEEENGSFKNHFKNSKKGKTLKGKT
jgi:hypothetical protein